jgi:hypothetical protein
LQSKKFEETAKKHEKQKEQQIYKNITEDYYNRMNNDRIKKMQERSSLSDEYNGSINYQKQKDK